MANYRGHTVGAIAFCAVYAGVLVMLPLNVAAYTAGLLSNWQFVFGMFIVAILFGLWPDVDTNSKGQDIFFRTAFVLDMLLIWQGSIEAAAYFGLIAMTPILGKHRGWTHSKLSMVLVPLPIALVPYLYKGEWVLSMVILYGAAVVGYFSHLLLDGRILRWFRIKS